MRTATEDEREDRIISIENAASTISSQPGSAAADGVFRQYGAHSADDDPPDVFSELYAIEADLR